MAAATQLIHLPFNSGAHEEADRRLVPNGLLKRAENVRLRRSGALGVRYGYTAQPAVDDEDSALTVFDVASHDDTLLAFGTTNASAGGPERVFSLVGGEWRAEDQGATRPRLFSALSDVRQVFRPPFVRTDEAVRYDVAYAGGYVALVHESHADVGSVLVNVFDPATGAAILSTEVAARSVPRVAAAGAAFLFGWVDSAGDVRVAGFDPASGTALGSETTIHTAGTVTAGFDLAAVQGASEVVALVVRSDNGAAALYRLSAAGSVQATGALTATDVSLGSVVTDSGGSTHVAYVDTSGNYELQSFSTAALTSTVGPTTLFSGATGSRPPGIAVKGTELVVSAAIPDTIDQQLRVDVRTAATHVVVTQYTHREVSQQSKPFVSPDGQFVGVVSPYGEDSLVNFTGVFDVEHGRGYELAVNRGFAVDALADCLGSVATDGTRYWFVAPVTDLNCSHTPTVVECRVMSPERRQTASLGGLLYVAGGFVGVWDGQRLVESGYFDAPTIESATPSNSTGTLTSNTVYSYVVTYEWFDAKGYRHQSPVSDPVTVTMGASDDTVTLVVSTPHSIRRIAGSTTSGKLNVYRTLAAPDRVHRRAAFDYVTTTFAQTVTIVDEASDDEVRTQEVVYTQGARGSLSGPLQHEAPFPTRYLWTKRDRLIHGGLPSESQWQQSKRQFPGEPLEHSSTLGFFGEIRGRITAVASQDDQDYVFSRNEVFIVEGGGPDDNGNGEFSPPRKLPGDDVGCIDWRSVVASAAGVWFQAAPDRLYLLPRGGGAPEWRSQPVRETLEAFPVVVAAAVVSRDNVVCWALQNAGGTAGRLVCHDTRSGEWYVDTLTDLGGPITAMCEHGGQLAVVVGGRVYLQNSAFPAATFLEYGVTTGSVAPFGTDGHGKLKSLTVAGEYRGDCQVQASVSYDDEGTFTAIGDPFELGAQTVGDTVELQWWPLRRKGSRFTLKFEVTAPADSAATEGLLLNHLTLEVQPAQRARRATRAERR